MPWGGNLCPVMRLWSRRTRIHHRHRHPRKQPQERGCAHPQAQAHRCHRRVRIRQDLAGLRHHRCRIAAAHQRNLPGLHASSTAPRRGPLGRVDRRHRRRPGTQGGLCALHLRHRHRQSPGTCACFSRLAESRAGEPAAYSLNDGSIMYPGMKVDSWMWRAYAESGLYSADVPVQDFTEEQKRNLYETETKVKVGGVSMGYMRLVTRLKTNVLSKPVESLQKHIRAFVERAVVFVGCPRVSGYVLGAERARVPRQGHVDRPLPSAGAVELAASTGLQLPAAEYQRSLLNAMAGGGRTRRRRSRGCGASARQRRARIRSCRPTRHRARRMRGRVRGTIR